MRLALLGCDEQAAELLRSTAASEHVLVMACNAGECWDEVRALFPRAAYTEHWETLLDGTLIDGVIVARSGDEEILADQLRKLVQEAMPILTTHPLGMSMLVYYELDMIRRETGGVIVPYLPARVSPAIAELAAMVAEGDASEIGAVDQIVMHREMADRSRERVLEQFARDVDFLRYLCGDVTRLTALGSSGEAAYANLGVHMAGTDNLLVRWSVGPVEEMPGARLTLTAPRGKAVLHMPADAEPWRLETRTGGELRESEFWIDELGAEAVNAFTAAVEGGQIEPTWPDAAKTVELAETIDRSLVKGRTIELHQEEFSEAGTFKGTMTSLGCGLLLAALILLPMMAILQRVAAAAGLVRAAELIGKWPYLLLGVVLAFLVMQGLLKFAPSSSGRHPSAPPKPDE